MADLWNAHLAGEKTSFNPLGMAEALMGAMQHASDLKGGTVGVETTNFVVCLRKALHNTFRYGQGTWDMAGEKGLTTEDFVQKVGWRLSRYLAEQHDDDYDTDTLKPSVMLRRAVQNVDRSKLQDLFSEFDQDGNGAISMAEFEEMMIKLGLAPTSNVAQPSGSRSKEHEKTAV